MAVNEFAREKAITLLAAGRKQADVARELKVNKVTVHRWLQEPEFRRKVDDARTADADALIEEIRTLRGEALRVLRVKLAEDNLDAAKEVLRHIIPRKTDKHVTVDSYMTLLQNRAQLPAPSVDAEWEEEVDNNSGSE